MVGAHQSCCCQWRHLLFEWTTGYRRRWAISAWDCTRRGAARLSKCWACSGGDWIHSAGYGVRRYCLYRSGGPPRGKYVICRTFPGGHPSGSHCLPGCALALRRSYQSFRHCGTCRAGSVCNQSRLCKNTDPESADRCSDSQASNFKLSEFRSLSTWRFCLARQVGHCIKTKQWRNKERTIKKTGTRGPGFLYRSGKAQPALSATPVPVPPP